MLHTRVWGAPTCMGVGGGRWLQFRRTRGAGNALPKAAAPPAQPASPPGSLARSEQGQGRGRGLAVASQGDTAPSPHRAQCPQWGPAHESGHPKSQRQNPSLERWCGLLCFLHTAGAFPGQALFGARASQPAGVLRGKGLGQAACSEMQLSNLPSPCQPLLSRALSGEAGSARHSPGGGRCGEAGSGGHGPGGGRTVSTGRGRKPHGGEAAMLQVTDAPGAIVGHPGALGWWRPRVGSKG